MERFHWTPEFVMTEITGSQGWIYFAWGKVNQAGFFGSNLEVTGGYHSQHVQKILKEK